MACGFLRARSWDVLGSWQNGETPLTQTSPSLGQVLALLSAPLPTPRLSSSSLEAWVGQIPNAKLKTKAPKALGWDTWSARWCRS